MEAVALYDKVRSKRGESLVFLKAVEEMGELIKSISKFIGEGEGEQEDLLGSVEEEIADVTIMMEQLRLIFFPTIIDRIRKEKLERLEERVKTW